MTIKLPSTLTTWCVSSTLRPPEPMFLCFYVHRVVSACGAWFECLARSGGGLHAAISVDLQNALSSSWPGSEQSPTAQIVRATGRRGKWDYAQVRLTIQATDTLYGGLEGHAAKTSQIRMRGSRAHRSASSTRRRSAAPTTPSARAREERGLDRPGARAPSARHTRTPQQKTRSQRVTLHP